MREITPMARGSQDTGSRNLAIACFDMSALSSCTPCILAMALSGLSALSVRMVLKMGMLPTPRREAPKLMMETATMTKSWRQLYKNRSSRKIDSQRLLSRESDFPKTFSLTENQISGKTYVCTIHPRRHHASVK